MRTEKSQEMKAMRLTRNEHHRKLRAPIRDISCECRRFRFLPPPCRVSAWKIAPPFVPPRLPLPPTTTCCLPRLPAASHDYLLPSTTTCCLPRLPAAFHR